jgi:hypothetical protein
MAPSNSYLAAPINEGMKLRKALYLGLIFVVIPLVQRILTRLQAASELLDRAAFTMGRKLQR